MQESKVIFYQDITHPSHPMKEESKAPLLETSAHPPPPFLPVGWSAIWDVTHGRFYFKSATGVTTWDQPLFAQNVSPEEYVTLKDPGAPTPTSSCLPPASKVAPAKTKAEQLESTRKMLEQPPITKANSHQQIAFDLGVVSTKQSVDYSTSGSEGGLYQLQNKFVTRTLGAALEGGGTTEKRTVVLTGGMRTVEVRIYPDLY